ncbi:phage-shock protein [Erythrobacter sp. SG61-1L]|uniref:envelope stress response membrane protein PspC n=1 Tax=Erythrobacter sp. SG61-1L TaxID=1603897 RepID=UPI0006C9165E|nr:envelope stress response membrane protein PspC [Erythrobacter sp. SG61-1L]KPL69752.1 phage-shock protein [Erythrobacter sp. SG61-1L]KPL69795.1 phage-shock protein [Erythrobacter sp. SG61-1L]
MNSPRTMLYRDTQNGKVFGVCAGIADYTGVNVLWIRLATVALTVMGVGFIPLAYFALAMFVQKKPADLYVDRDEQKYWQRVRQSPKRTAREIRARFRDIDRRLAEVESYYVSSNPRLSAEIENLR